MLTRFKEKYIGDAAFYNDFAKCHNKSRQFSG